MMSILEYINAYSQHLVSKEGSSNQKRIEDLQAKQVYMNIIMNAFGNAKTPRNDDSSRFGKMINVYFTPEGGLHSLGVTEYLLERTRCIRIPEERKEIPTIEDQNNTEEDEGRKGKARKKEEKQEKKEEKQEKKEEKQEKKDSFRPEDRPFHVFYYLCARDELENQKDRAEAPAFTWTERPVDQDIIDKYKEDINPLAQSKRPSALWTKNVKNKHIKSLNTLLGKKTQNTLKREETLKLHQLTEYLRFVELEHSLKELFPQSVERIWEVLRFILHVQSMYWDPNQTSTCDILRSGDYQNQTVNFLHEKCANSVLRVRESMMGSDSNPNLDIEFGWHKRLSTGDVQAYTRSMDPTSSMYQTLTKKLQSDPPDVAERKIAATFGLFSAGTLQLLRIRRDSMSKQVYKVLWEYLINGINLSLHATGDRHAHHISILDIFGFEDFKVVGPNQHSSRPRSPEDDNSTRSHNGLDQLCIVWHRISP